ncbi:MAG: hypothetical protein AUJ49_08840 [Desulfovibrionaceae bacterium CG1_02_65_16]|nr:MAG: hypothetical protein AUJ49_08840 [Desulfovibrionaceae bacterium CG1_02_65_16]
MKSADHTAAKLNRVDASCASNQSAPPFCGLGDVQCLTERFAACSGMRLVEHPLPPKDQRGIITARS